MGWLTGMHGILALYNNAILSYLHDRPETTLEMLVALHLRSFQPEAMKRRGGKSSRRRNAAPKNRGKKKTGRTKKR